LKTILAVADLRMIEVRPASAAEWDAIWRDCNYATYFHGRGWAGIWSEYSHGRMQPAPLLLRFSDGCHALMPLSRERLYRGLMTRTWSSPAGTYGGWISDTPLGEAHVRLLAQWLPRCHRLLVWRANPYAPVAALPDDRWKPDHTRAIDLSVGFEAVVRQWNRGHRSAVNKAIRNGIEIRLANAERDWLEYHDVYEDSLRRWGDAASSRYGRGLFEILHRHADADDAIRLWLATHQGRIIAGAICLYGPAMAVYWHGAALEQHFESRPVNLLLHHAIRDAAERGYAWFDFNPSGGHAGVEHFKAGFGGQIKPAPVLETDPLAFRLIHAASTAWNWKHRS
jgi:CelD/BcsL family acetyltransferase involved in cellulose biosynthesis